MSEGKPVTILFVLLIAFMVFMYVRDLQQENDRLYNIAVDQEEVIEQLKSAITSMQILNTLQGNYSIPVLPYQRKEDSKTDPI